MRLESVVGGVAGLVVLASGLPVSIAAMPCPAGWGDVDGDLDIDVADIQCGLLSVLYSHLGEPSPACESPAATADVSCDGQVTVADILVLATSVLVSPLPAAIDSNGDACPDDCQWSCGDLVCDSALGESCASCIADCACAANASCSVDGSCVEWLACPSANPCNEWVNTTEPGCSDPACCAEVCGLDPFCCQVTWDFQCASRASGLCAPTCGDGLCSSAAGETCATCPADCPCVGADTCVLGSCQSCDALPTCGDAECGFALCGDSLVSCGACPVGTECLANQRCAACGDGLCEASEGETCQTCPEDCSCEPNEGCVPTAGCVPLQACPPAEPVPLYCNQSLMGFTSPTSQMDTYDVQLAGLLQFPGGEAVFDVEIPASETYFTFRVVGPPDQLGLLVSPSSDACSSTSGWHREPSKFSDTLPSLTLSDSLGDLWPRIAVVESLADGPIPFLLELSCSAPDSGPCDSVECGVPALPPTNPPTFCGACPSGEACGQLRTCVPCGDGTCDLAAGETCLSCEADCGCSGEHVCAEYGGCTETSESDDGILPVLSCFETETIVLHGDGPNSLSSYLLPPNPFSAPYWRHHGGPDAVVRLATEGSPTVRILAKGDAFVFGLKGAPSSAGVVAAAPYSPSFGETVLYLETHQDLNAYLALDTNFGWSGTREIELTLECTSACGPDTACSGGDCGPKGCGWTTVHCGGCELGEFCDATGTCAPNPFPDSCPGAFPCGGAASAGITGCADPTCCATVCAVDHDCCTEGWDSSCANIATNTCSTLHCGNLECEPEVGETCQNCHHDCACPLGSTCDGTECTPPVAPPPCGNRQCGTVLWGGEVASCGSCVAPQTCTSTGQCIACGDGLCDALEGEDCNSCQLDCGCGAAGDCSAFGTCLPTAACGSTVEVEPIICGAIKSGFFAGESTPLVHYTCAPEPMPAKEKVFSFTADATGTVRIVNYKAQDSFGNALDSAILVMEGSCDSGACIAAGHAELFVAVEVGKTYYIAVDSTGSWSSVSYEFLVECVEPCEAESICETPDICGPIACQVGGVDCGPCTFPFVCAEGGCRLPDTPFCDSPTGCTPSSALTNEECHAALCCHLVCDLDAYCCDVVWDQSCAVNSLLLCGDAWPLPP